MCFQNKISNFVKGFCIGIVAPSENGKNSFFSKKPYFYSIFYKNSYFFRDFDKFFS